MDGASDALIVREQIEVAEEEGPIVFATADEWQLLHPRIAHVHGDVPEILRDPPERDARGMTITLSREVPGERRGNNQLEERSSRKLNHVPEWREDEMPRLVNREIDSVEKASCFRMAHQRNGVQREQH